MKILSAVVFAASFGLLASACAEQEDGGEKAGSPEVETGEVAQAAFGSWSPFNGATTNVGVMGLAGRNVGGVTYAHAVSLKTLGTIPQTFSCRLEEHTPSSATSTVVGGLGSCDSYIGLADAVTRDDVFWASGSNVASRQVSPTPGSGASFASVPDKGVALSVRPFSTETDMWFTTGGMLRQAMRYTDGGAWSSWNVEPVPFGGSARQPAAIWTNYLGDSVLSVLVPSTTGLYRAVYRQGAGAWDFFTGPSTYFDDQTMTYSPPKSGVAVAERNPGQLRLAYVGRIAGMANDEVCVRYSNNAGTSWLPGTPTAPSAICLGAPAVGLKQSGGLYATPAAVSKGSNNVELLVLGADDLIYTYTMSF